MTVKYPGAITLGQRYEVRDESEDEPSNFIAQLFATDPDATIELLEFVLANPEDR